jgi:hypothetical protein
VDTIVPDINDADGVKVDDGEFKDKRFSVSGLSTDDITTAKALHQVQRDPWGSRVHEARGFPGSIQIFASEPSPEPSLRKFLQINRGELLGAFPPGAAECNAHGHVAQRATPDIYQESLNREFLVIQR